MKQQEPGRFVTHAFDRVFADLESRSFNKMIADIEKYNKMIADIEKYTSFNKMIVDIEKYTSFNKTIVDIEKSMSLNKRMLDLDVSTKMTHAVTKAPEAKSHVRLVIRSQTLPFTFERPPRRRIQVAPGIGVARVLKRICSRKVYERVYEPQIADLQREYVDALTEKDQIKACLVRLRFAVGLIKTVLMAIPLSVVQAVINIWKAG